MAKIYFNRLITGTITYNEIPLRYINAVKEIGIEWVQSGRMSAEEYEKYYNEPFNK